MIKLSEYQIQQAIFQGFIEEMEAMDKTAGALTWGAKYTANLLGKSIKYLKGSKYKGGRLQQAFTHAHKAYQDQGGRAMLQSLARHRNPHWYIRKGEDPVFSKLQQRKSSIRRGILHNIGTTAAKLDDLTKGMTGVGQTLGQKTKLFFKNAPSVAWNDVRGSFKFREVADIPERITKGRVYMKRGGKILDPTEALKLYQANPKVATKNLYHRFGWNTKGTKFSRQLEYTGDGLASMRRRKQTGLFAAGMVSAPGIAATTALSKTDSQGRPRPRTKSIVAGIGELGLWGINPAIGTAAMIPTTGKMFKDLFKKQKTQQIQQLQ